MDLPCHLPAFVFPHCRLHHYSSHTCKLAFHGTHRHISFSGPLHLIGNDPASGVPRTMSAHTTCFHLCREASSDYHCVTVLPLELSPVFLHSIITHVPTRTSVPQGQQVLSVLFTVVGFSANKIDFPESLLPPQSSAALPINSII